MAGVRRLRHGEYAEKFSSLQNARRCGEIAQAGLPPRTVTGQATPASMWRGMLSEVQIAASGVRLGLIRLAAGTADLVADALAAADAVVAASART